MKWENYKKYWWIGLLFIFFFAMIFLHYQMQLYGDDFWYGIYHKGGLISCIIESAKIYLTTNGRLIPNIFNSIILMDGINFWRVLNPLMICLLLITILGISKHKKFIGISLFALIALFLNMDIFISQESIYWLTGSCNYIYPLTLILLNFYFVKRYNDKEGFLYKHKKLAWILIVTTFLTSFLVEQTAFASGMLIFGLLTYNWLIRKEKINPILFFCFIATIFAFLLIFFSPGCSSRIDAEQTLSGFSLIINNIKLLLNLLFFYRPFQIINLILLLGLNYYFYKNIKKNRYLSLLVNINILSLIVFTYIIFKSSAVGYFDFYSLAPLIKLIILGGIVVFIIDLIIYSLLLLFNDRDENVLNFICMGYGVQAMMLLSPTMGYRTTLITYVVYMFIILQIFNFMLLNISIKDRYSKRCLCILCFAVLSLICGYKYFDLYKNYKINSDILFANEQIVLNYAKNDFIDVKAITLYKVPLQNYRWMLPYESHPHMIVYREYYGIPDYVEIEFK